MSKGKWTLGYLSRVRCTICGRLVEYGAVMEVDPEMLGVDRFVLCGLCDSPARRAGLEEIAKRKQDKARQSA